MSLHLSALQGRVSSLLINQPDGEDFIPRSLDQVQAKYAGFEGDAHFGLTRKSCVRVKNQYPKGTEIRNVRQLSILSEEELSSIASAMGIAQIKPEWVIANLVVAGIPDFTLLPPSSRLIFSTGASLVIDMVNKPCAYPGSLIEKHHSEGKSFARNAINLRGVTAWVEREGSISVDDTFDVHMPRQPPYPHLTVQ